MVGRRMRAACASAVLGLAATPVVAHAYCRTTSEAGSAACPAPCPSGGVELAWGTPELEYALHRDAFSELPDSDVRAALARAFAAWADVSCSGRPIGFTFHQLSARSELTLGPAASEPNTNVISQLQPDVWRELGLDSHLFAKTQLWFDTTTGEIVGADIAFNAAIGAYAICPDAGCSASQIDLENVATHEIGHLLGLAHSADPSATMWCDAVQGDLAKRTLERDDREGLCAMYGSDGAFLDPGPDAGAPAAAPNGRKTSSAGGCALGAASEPPTLAIASLALFPLFRRRRKLAFRAPSTQERHA